MAHDDGALIVYENGRGRWVNPGDGDYPSGGGAQGDQGPQGDQGSQGSQGAQGAQGSQGSQGSAGLPVGQRLSGSWAYDSASQTASQPTNGNFRFNNATEASATEMYISANDFGGVSRHAEIAAWGASANVNPKGYLFIADSFSPGPNGQLVVTITGPLVDHTTWFTIPVTVQQLSVSALTTEPCLFIFQPVGGPSVWTNINTGVALTQGVDLTPAINLAYRTEDFFSFKMVHLYGHVEAQQGGTPGEDITLDFTDLLAAIFPDLTTPHFNGFGPAGIMTLNDIGPGVFAIAGGCCSPVLEPKFVGANVGVSTTLAANDRIYVRVDADVIGS